MKVTVVYGSDNGATRSVANKIAAKMGGQTIDITAAKAADFKDCDLLILGAPTYGAGNLQPDWEDRLDLLKDAGLSGKKVALFGLGDQAAYSDTFVDAIGLLYDAVVEQGATVVGNNMPTSGYDYTASLAERDGGFVGLALDQDNQASKTEQRIDSWIARLS